jgi:hypothetical protein
MCDVHHAKTVHRCMPGYFSAYDWSNQGNQGQTSFLSSSSSGTQNSLHGSISFVRK